MKLRQEARWPRQAGTARTAMQLLMQRTDVRAAVLTTRRGAKALGRLVQGASLRAVSDLVDRLHGSGYSAAALRTYLRGLRRRRLWVTTGWNKA